MSVVGLPSTQEPIAPSRQSLLALSWLNFFLSGMQTAFGQIAAAYLAAAEWTAKDIGFALSIGGIASLISQVPGGELIDSVRAKRLLVAICVIIVASSILVFRLWPSFPVVALAEVLQGISRTSASRHRWRCGYPDDGCRRVFRLALGNVCSGRSRRSTTGGIESD